MNILQRNNVHQAGSGRQTIMFGHGFGCDQTVWQNIVPYFKEDYQVVLFDYVGSGNSDKSVYSAEKYNSLHGYAEDVIDVCDALGLQKIIFVGHSVSGMIGALASMKRPELIEQLIMIGPSPRYINEPGYQGGFDRSDIDELLDMMEVNYREWAKYLAPVASKNEDRPEVTERFEELLNANDPVIARQFAEVTFTSDIRSDLPNVTVRTLVLQTKEDAIVPGEVSEYIVEHIPNSSLVVMDAKGHNPHLSHPYETVLAIKEFLEKA